MRFSSRILLLLLCLLPLAALPTAAHSNIQRARRDIERLRYDRAEQHLVDIAKSAAGREKQEALFLLAGLKDSVSEAQIIYQEVIRLDPSNEWGKRAQVELAKIQYALGHYSEAWDMLERSSACRTSEEACYFQGLSAMMLERYSEAKEPLSRVRRGKYQTWAFLSLAEIEMNLDNTDEACRKYRSIARAAISPTAMYRYAECLEKQGDPDGARKVFDDIVERFKNTPEAVLAAQKLEVFRTTRERPPLERPVHTDVPLTKGFTIQFGAFHDRTNAIRLAAQLKRELPGLRIDSDLLDHREVHRVRYGYFASRDEAQKKADELRRVIDEPFTIMPLP